MTGIRDNLIVQRTVTGQLPEGLRAFLPYAGGEWFRSFYRNNANAEADHLQRRLAQNASGKILIEAREGNKLCGVAALERLNWDSAHFGLEMYRAAPVLLAQTLPPAQRMEAFLALHRAVLDAACEAGARMVLRRLRSVRLDEVRALEQIGYRLADNVVTMSVPLNPGSYALPAGLHLRSISSSDVPAARQLMRGSFALSRFCLEPSLAARGEAVYMEWIKNAFANETIPPHGYVIECDGEFAGFTIWTRDAAVDVETARKLALLDLFVVGDRWRGRGLGTALLAGTLIEMARCGAESCEASTWIGQSAAMATYQKLGFAVRENLLSFYLDVEKTA